MKIALYTNEFPPHIYGGAGIHVDFLSRELKKEIQVEVRCFGEQEISEPNMNVVGLSPSLHAETQFPEHQSIMNTLSRNLEFSRSTPKADLVHCHTWYSHFAGVLTKNLLQVPLILTTHSLEPHRPWKVEQLGNGYELTCWIEKTAYEFADGIIAVSQDMKRDVIEAYNVDPDRVRVIYNGIDLNFYQPTFDEQVLRDVGVDPTKPIVLFVGRITRQKGITGLLKTLPFIDANAQIVLCAGAPDTPEIAEEMKSLYEEVSAKRPGVIWIQEMLGHDKLKVLYSHAAVFVCPSLYEPFGIINLEAMACGTPVVGSHVGGIPEIIVEGETGFLVPFEAVSKVNFEPQNPEKFQRDLAEKINLILSDSDLRDRLGRASRARVEALFSWEAIAKQTLEFYQEVITRFNQKK